MEGLKIWQGCEYARVTQGAEYCLNNAGYDWICRNIPEKTVLNMSEFWMSLLQYLTWGHCANYWTVIETDVFRTLSNI